MRPERLELQGFTAFREPTVVDFEGAELFALTGATGAGKSSVIDAVCFALYGIVPRYDDRRLVAPVISQGRNEARVALDFSVGDERYRAARVVRASGSGATTKEARLVRVGADGAEEVLAGNADELTAAVTRLLGLTFEHFTTCVVLPQGDFAQFLHAKPSSRQKLLVELLDLGLYDRMRRLAREREVAAEGEAAGVEQELVQARAQADPARLAELTARSGELERLIARIDDEQVRIDALQQEAAQATVRATAAREQAVLLAGVVRPDGVDDLAGALARARAELEAARAADDQAVAAVEAAEKALGALPSRAELEAMARVHQQLAEARERRAKGEARLAAQRELVVERTERAAGADAALVAAEAAHDAARRSSLVADLMAGLGSGDPCPVCGGSLHDVDLPEGTELDAAREHLDDARTEQREAADALTEARSLLGRIEEKLAEVADDVARLSAELADALPPERLDEVRGEVQSAEEALAAARAAATAGRTRRQAADEQVAAATTAESRGRAAFDTARDRVAALGPPAPARQDLAADWDDLVAWAERERPERAAAQAEAEAAADTARRAAEARYAEVVEACRAVGVQLAGRLPRDVLVEARAEVDAEAARRRLAAERVGELEERHAELVETRDVAHELALHLKSDRFEKWVLDAALRHLVAGATGILHALSGGTYSLTLEPKTSNFAVVDHANADAVRSARTLSGGETFLASLALALALADEVAHLAAGGAARLESMFLDEGFGTLDADTLDTVAGAIEDLGAQGRTVGLVTHVTELAERLPVRFVVTKTPSGSQVERVER